jgi:hypothetical protein
MWQGENFKGQLIVLSEGGAGDRICYSRFLPMLNRRGFAWKYCCAKGTEEQFARLPWCARHIYKGEELKNEETCWTTCFALPANLDISPTEIPFYPSLFTADEDAIEKYKFPRFDKKPVIGLCYSANEAFQGGRKVRSMTEGQAMRLVSMTGHLVHWVSLQHGERMPYPVATVKFDSYEDACGLIANLDAVVTVDTFVMHMAGAMGKPLATVLSSHSDWKFLQTGTRCVWYPTARLYRNGQGGGMEHAIDQLIADIRDPETMGRGTDSGEFRKLLCETVTPQTGLRGFAA